MMTPIAGAAIEQVAPVSPLRTPTEVNSSSGTFSDVLRSAIERVEASGADATAAAEKFMSGEAADLHSAALATQRAALQLEYVLQVRNKVVQAYQEIMRMQL